MMDMDWIENMSDREKEAEVEADKIDRQNRLEQVFLSRRSAEDEGTIWYGMDG